MIVALLLAAATPQTLPAMFGGSLPSLRKLAVAARRCGYPDASVTRASFGAWVVAVPAPIIPPDDGSPFFCVAQWMFAHPKLGLGFIGNEAPSPETK